MRSETPTPESRSETRRKNPKLLEDANRSLPSMRLDAQRILNKRHDLRPIQKDGKEELFRGGVGHPDPVLSELRDIRQLLSCLVTLFKQ